jgi:TRAP-type C4-dicarboxylate transport system permease small subunit
MPSTPTQHPAPALFRRLQRAVDATDSMLVAIGGAMLFALMCLVVADVTRRYLFNAPIAWSYEIINSYLMPGLFFLAVSHALRVHAHVAVDILHNYVGTRWRNAFETVAMTLAVPVFGVATWLAAGKTLHDFRSAAESSSGLGLPTWTISIVFPIGFGVLTLRLALHAAGYAASLFTGRQVLALPPISGTEESAE